MKIKKDKLYIPKYFKQNPVLVKKLSGNKVWFVDWKLHKTFVCYKEWFEEKFEECNEKR